MYLNKDQEQHPDASSSLVFSTINHGVESSNLSGDTRRDCAYLVTFQCDVPFILIPPLFKTSTIVT